MPKILSNKPWLLVIGAFLAFVGLWVAFIVFAVRHQPPQVPVSSHGGAAVEAAKERGPKDGGD